MLPYGQSRVLAAWDELILPNGSRISLRGMSAADGQGQSGMEDQVDNHFWKTWSSALLVSFWGLLRNSRNRKTRVHSTRRPAQLKPRLRP
jgi:type IV secretory pathway VirB10-like protein